MKKTAKSKQLFNPITIRSSEGLASALRRIRKLKGLSQTKLAKKSGMTQATISRVESGTRHTELGTFIIILAALGVDLTITDRAKDDTYNPLEGLY